MADKYWRIGSTDGQQQASVKHIPCASRVHLYINGCACHVHKIQWAVAKHCVLVTTEV